VTILAITELAALLALAALHVRQGGRLARVVCQLAAAERRANAAITEADRWRRANQLLSWQLAGFRRPPAPGLSESEAEAWVDIAEHWRER
jgi:hypothetical protein